MKKRIRILIPLALLAAAATVVVLRGRGNGSEGLFASGTVEATEADLGFQLPGRIEEIVPREGDAVSGGELLARLDVRELTAGRDAALAEAAEAEALLRELRRGTRGEEVALAEAAVRAATRQAEEASRDAARARRLFEGGAVSRQAVDRAETALEVARSAMEQAEQRLALAREGPRAETVEAQEARVARARAQVERAEAALANAVVTAPFPGLVTVRHRQPGETVAPGSPVLTLLDPADRWVRIYVREDVVGRVAIGQRARIVSDSWPDRSYDGEVVFIGSQAEFTPRNVQTAEERTKLVYPVKVRIVGDPGFELKPGVPADVTLDEPGG